MLVIIFVIVPLVFVIIAVLGKKDGNNAGQPDITRYGFGR